MSAFDDKYGTRPYPGPDGQIAAWEGDEGWSAFLNFTLGNLVQNVLRQEIGNVECADLVASCSLAANSSAQAAAAAVIDPNANGNQTINQVQAAVNDAFSRDVNDVLGVDTLIHPRFVLSKIAAGRLQLLPDVRADRRPQGAARRPDHLRPRHRVQRHRTVRHARWPCST
ncbi:MAG TPA: hypothetical protein VGO95_12395 [Modestobacter sp.]|nr:hypothetical protein [Modestobacter sp.]